MLPSTGVIVLLPIAHSARSLSLTLRLQMDICGSLVWYMHLAWLLFVYLAVVFCESVYYLEHMDLMAP